MLPGCYFLFKDIRLRNEHISKLSQEVSSLSSKQDYLVSTQKMIGSINQDIIRIDNSIITKDGDVAFIENLELIAKSNGLTLNIDSLVFEDDTKLTGAGLTTLKIKAKTTGNWSNTYRFLSQIESLPFKIKVNRLEK